jgi:hypothetical protein
MSHNLFFFFYAKSSSCTFKLIYVFMYLIFLDIRYKIYIEGYGWSVSEKYILACDSPTLLVKPRYYDFFTRSLQPLQHYWPIKENDKCKSIKHAVDWGNTHQQKVSFTPYSIFLDSLSLHFS